MVLLTGRVKRSIAGLLKAIEGGLCTPAMKDKMQALERRRTELAQKLVSAPTPATAMVQMPNLTESGDLLGGSELSGGHVGEHRMVADEGALPPSHGKAPTPSQSSDLPATFTLHGEPHAPDRGSWQVYPHLITTEIKLSKCKLIRLPK